MVGVKISAVLLFVVSCTARIAIGLNITEDRFLFFIKRTWFNGWYNVPNQALHATQSFSKWAIFTSHCEAIIQREHLIRYMIKTADDSDYKESSEVSTEVDNPLNTLSELDPKCIMNQESNPTLDRVEYESHGSVVRAFFSVGCSIIEKVKPFTEAHQESKIPDKSPSKEITPIVSKNTIL